MPFPATGAARRESDLAAFLGRPGRAVATLRPRRRADPLFHQVPAAESGFSALGADAGLEARPRASLGAIGFEIDGLPKLADLQERPGRHPHTSRPPVDRGGDVRMRGGPERRASGSARCSRRTATRWTTSPPTATGREPEARPSVDDLAARMAPA